MTEIIQIISLSCIGVLWVVSEPTILFRRYLGFRDDDIQTYSKTKLFFHKLINCAMCTSFWVGLICTGSIYIAAIVSILAEIIINKLL
jgi:hypothetical protein